MCRLDCLMQASENREKSMLFYFYGNIELGAAALIHRSMLSFVELLFSARVWRMNT
jgi:hypothetical protein